MSPRFQYQEFHVEYRTNRRKRSSEVWHTIRVASYHLDTSIGCGVLQVWLMKILETQDLGWKHGECEAMYEHEHHDCCHQHQQHHHQRY